MFRVTTWFLLLGTTLAILHTAAISLYLYMFYWWFDVLMHLLGGAFVVMALGALVDLGWARPVQVLRPAVALAVLTVVMVAWELFEFVVRVTRSDNFALDTVSDLIFGLIGGVAGWLLVRKLLRTRP